MDTTTTPTCRYASGDRQPPPGFPVECAGLITWRRVGDAFTWHYCVAHGGAHATMSPFAGYEKVASR